MTRRTRLPVQLAVGTLRSPGKRKVFCVGKNKTGTTSVAKAFSELGLIVGVQRPGELLLRDWARRDFRKIILYCYTAQAFQDIPFSLPFTFQALDQRFPGSKFILTVRGSPEQWYESLTRFHAALFGHGHIPTPDDLKAADYVHPGSIYEGFRLIHNTPADDLYDEQVLTAEYNDAVLEYFQHRTGDLLVLNVAEPGAYDKLCQFLRKPCTGKEFPWENKTADVEKRLVAR